MAKATDGKNKPSFSKAQWNALMVAEKEGQVRGLLPGERLSSFTDGAGFRTIISLHPTYLKIAGKLDHVVSVNSGERLIAHLTQKGRELLHETVQAPG